jgi:hypothetical protein
MTLGGRASEMIFFNRITTGAQARIPAYLNDYFLKVLKVIFEASFGL